MDQETPDWILARADCTIDGVFGRLIDTISRDVNRFNELPSNKRGNREFKYSRKDQNSVVIGYNQDEGIARSETVCIRKQCWDVEVYRNSLFQFKIDTGWNIGSLSFDLKVDGKVQPPWMISQMALVDLLFPRD